MKTIARFSISFLLLLTAIVAGFFSGVRTGERRGEQAVLQRHNQAELFVAIRQEFPGQREWLFVETLRLPVDESTRLEGQGLGNWIVEIITQRIDPPLPDLERLELTGKGTLQATFQLQNISAHDAQRRVKSLISRQPNTVFPDPVENSITVDVNSKRELKMIEEMIEHHDRRPTMWKLKIQVGKKTKNGDIVWVSKPHLAVLENSRGTVALGSANGQLVWDVSLSDIPLLDFPLGNRQ